ncbi:MAG: malto-oligosyltrehalose trehalohydrolase [Candidatus Riflebacteria bacterium]|nr:malto-oligosyltrehalose trehalohydrolase [Candidatus Riflebacteria bacterium]
MTSFKVWAPKAKSVSICVTGEEHSMQSQSNGFWQIELKGLKQPVLYAYKIDGNGPFPDPVSKFQPEGIHGRSQIWQDNYKWNDNNWRTPELKNAIIYELHVGTFSPHGTYSGITEKLDHLVELGVTHVELMPIAAFPGHHGWGYDGVALYAPHNTYGTPVELKQLVDSCHQHGLAVILDVVYNHLGPDGNYLGLYGPYFSKRYHTPWGEAVNFDCAQSDQVREFIINNALMWLRDYHFDGLRLDAIHAIYDASATHILEEMQNRVDALTLSTGRSYCLIAESDLNDPRIINQRKNGGYGLAAQWLDDFHHALHVTLTGEQQGYYQGYSGHENLNKCLSDYFVYDGCYSPSRQRRHGRPAGHLSPDQFIVSTQTHDQVGNRGLGERLCHLTTYDNCEIAAALMLLSPFVPMLFQGEEWAATSPFLYFTDHTDANLARAVRQGRRRDYAFLNKRVPDPQAAETFVKSLLNWKEIGDEAQVKMLNWYKQLICLRQHYIEHIRDSQRSFKPADDSNCLFVYSAGRVKTLVNIGKRRQKLADAGLANARILLQNKPLKADAGQLTILPGTAAVLLTE